MALFPKHVSTFSSFLWEKIAARAATINEAITFLFSRDRRRLTLAFSCEALPDGFWWETGDIVTRRSITEKLDSCSDTDVETLTLSRESRFSQRGSVEWKEVMETAETFEEWPTVFVTDLLNRWMSRLSKLLHHPAASKLHRLRLHYRPRCHILVYFCLYLCFWQLLYTFFVKWLTCDTCEDMV